MEKTTGDPKKTHRGRPGLHCHAPIQKESLNKHTLRGGHPKHHREGNAPASPGPGGSEEPVDTPCQDTPYHASPRPSSPASSLWPEGQRTRASALRATAWGLLSSVLAGKALGNNCEPWRGSRDATSQRERDTSKRA